MTGRRIGRFLLSWTVVLKKKTKEDGCVVLVGHRLIKIFLVTPAWETSNDLWYMVRWSSLWPEKEKKFCTGYQNKSPGSPWSLPVAKAKTGVEYKSGAIVSPWIWFILSVTELPGIQGPDVREVPWARCWLVCAGCNQLHNKIIIHSILVWSGQTWMYLSLWSYGRHCAVKHWDVSCRMLCLSSNWISWHSLQQCCICPSCKLSPAVKPFRLSHASTKWIKLCLNTL